MSESVKAAAASWARVVGTAVATWLVAKVVDGQLDVFALTVADAKAAVSIAAGATVLTVVNWLRPGDTRFGNGADA